MTLDQLPLQLTDASGVPYYRQIVEQIALLIRSGDLKPSTRLPSFRDLASQLVVSLITVRRSYAELETAGLIVRKQGQGTFVAEQVEKATRAQVRKDGRLRLQEAVEYAKQLGLKNQDIRDLVEKILDGTGKAR